MRTRVERLSRQTKGSFSYAESANLQQVRRQKSCNDIQMLRDVYLAKGVE